MLEVPSNSKLQSRIKSHESSPLKLSINSNLAINCSPSNLTTYNYTPQKSEYYNIIK